MTGPRIRVEVVYALPDRQCLLELDVPAGTTLIEAVRRSGILERFPEIDPEAAPMGIFGKVVDDRERPLEAHDRVEIYRPLPNDPMTLRAQRAAAQRRRED